MGQIDLKILVDRLDRSGRDTLESAAGLCLSRSHFNVEIEHWLLKLLEVDGNDLHAILRRFEVPAARVRAALERALDTFETGNARPPALAPNLVQLAREAWVVASLKHSAARIRSGHLVAALLDDERFARQLATSCQALASLPRDTLDAEFARIVAGSVEDSEEAVAAPDSGPASNGAAATGGPLEKYTVDLTARARAGAIDPIVGRDAEIRQVIDILGRRRQNNPILTGEAGVGKTAVVEGFAQAIVRGDVPPGLHHTVLRTLDLGLLQAGAGVKGEFENRLKGVIEAVRASAQPIVLFIDEAHTMIGAGGQAGQGDAANLLKPALARGDLRTIAATTWAEYKKYFEKDAALSRRFQVVVVDEPDEERAIEMMGGLVATLEAHHGVRILDEAVVDAVRLSMRYVPGRQLPDKSVSLLDTAAARVRLSQGAVPPPLEAARRRAAELDRRSAVLEREQETGADHRERLAAFAAERAEVEAEREALGERWRRERALVDELVGVRARLAGEEWSEAAVRDGASAEPVSDAEREDLRHRYRGLAADLAELQGQDPLVHEQVDSQAVAEVVASWTGIPVGKMVADEIEGVLRLRERLAERVVGQDHALELIARSVQTGRANLTDPNRPIGVFLLAGTSGVGKTETALALADLLYGGEQNLTVINMSEFKEEHKVSLLLGSPPGYVGFGEGGVLTEAVRRRPYSVVLLDELEKAHPGVQEIFYQVFDKGTLKDGEGRDVDFRNTIILMTSNVGTDTIAALCADSETRPDAEALEQELRPDLLAAFKPAFLGRLRVVPYFPLDDEVLRKIVGLKLEKVVRRVASHYGAPFEYDPLLVQRISERCLESESGARTVDNLLNGTLLPELSREFLAAMAAGRTITRARVGLDAAGGFTYSVESRA